MAGDWHHMTTISKTLAGSLPASGRRSPRTATAEHTVCSPLRISQCSSHLWADLHIQNSLCVLSLSLSKGVSSISPELFYSPIRGRHHFCRAFASMHMDRTYRQLSSVQSEVLSVTPPHHEHLLVGGWQVRLEELEGELVELNGNSERLGKSHAELLELQLVLERASQFFDDAQYSASSAQDSRDEAFGGALAPPDWTAGSLHQIAERVQILNGASNWGVGRGGGGSSCWVRHSETGTANTYQVFWLVVRCHAVRCTRCMLLHWSGRGNEVSGIVQSRGSGPKCRGWWRRCTPAGVGAHLGAQVRAPRLRGRHHRHR